MNGLERLVARKLEDGGRSMEDLARDLDTTTATLERVLAHPRDLSLEDAMPLALSLGITLDEIGTAAFETPGDEARTGQPG